MSSPVSACSIALQIPTPKLRPIANFHPDVWGNQFMTYTPEDEVIRACKEKQVEDLKKEVRKKLVEAASSPSQLLNFIDAVQRLGVAYHFEGKIEKALEQIYDSLNEPEDIINGDLYNTALRFRLLRQQGYNTSCGIFDKFKDKQGGFKEDLITNVKGMLGLYEAAHFRVPGEDILEEALSFTTIHLKAMVEDIEYPLAAYVAHALNWSVRKSLERLEAKWYISIYQDDAFHDKTLLTLAKLDFNLVQSLHKEELRDLSRWWKELDFTSKLPFARDRLVEGYFWIVGVYFEPQYSCVRRILTKVFAMLSILDDIYDAYGTIEELKPFTEAIERWDDNNMNHLPDYMKLCYVTLLNLYKEFEEEMEKEGKHYRVHYGKEELKNQVRAYYAEASWFHEGRVPSMEEYMQVGLVTAGYTLLITSSLIGMGEIVTKETFEWVHDNPRIISSSNLMARLVDDLRSHKFEQKRGHAASAIECYMKQYGVCEEQVYCEFYKQVENAWLDINHECLQPTPVPMPILARIVNFSRVLGTVNKEGDDYTHVGKLMKDNIGSLFIDPLV